MKQKSVGMTLRAVIIALALILVAGSPALPPFDGVAYAQTGLSAVFVPDGSNVQVSWGAISGADSYEVWKGDGSGSSVDWGTSALASVEEPTVSYTDEAVTAGNTYSYAIRPVDDGTAGTWSNVVNVTIPGGTTAPTGAPNVSVAAVGTTAVDVSWTPISGATSYHIQLWHAALGNNWERIPGDQTSPYSHTGLTAGVEYFYVVRAVNAGGNGPWSNWRTDNSKVTLVTTSAVPTLTLDHQSRTVVQVSWTASSGGSTYNLERRKVYIASGDTATTADAWTVLNSSSPSTTSYTDSAANFVPTTAESVSYEYQVQAIDSNGIAGDWSAVKSVAIPKAGAVLRGPTSFRAAAVSSSSTRVTWAAVPGASFYQLHWKSGEGNYTNPIRVDGLSYEHLSLSPSTKYTYQVRAVDINGAGVLSSASSATTLSVTAAAGQMSKVTGLTVTDATDGEPEAERTAKLTWNAVSGATHYDIQRYDPSTGPGWGVLGGGTEVEEATRIAAASSPSHEDVFADGANGNTYFYVVSAVDNRFRAAQGEIVAILDEGPENDDKGEWSDYKSVTFLDFAPAVPTALSAAKTNGGSILVRWTAPAVDGEDGTATSYTLQWRTASTTAWSSLPVTSGTSYHHTRLSGNTTYFYKVRAENAGGMSPFTAPGVNEEPVSVTLGNTLTAPTGVRAEDATTVDAQNNTAAYGIKVSWNAVTGADSYEIQRFNPTAEVDVDPWGDLTGTAGQETPVPTGTEHPDTNSLTVSTTYLYRVRTVQEDARSAWSAVASGTTRAAPPATPTLVATGTGQSMIRLSWEAVDGATVYHLEFLEGEQVVATFDNPNTNPTRRTISGTFNNYVHSGRKAGTQYSYRLRAVLPEGEGAWSTIQTPYTKPATPDMTATATDFDTITLSWDAVPMGSGHLTTYRVEWRVSGSGNAWAGVTEPAACNTSNKCMLVDDALTESTHYQYRIRAESDVDTGNHNSYWDYTNQRTPREPEEDAN